MKNGKMKLTTKHIAIGAWKIPARYKEQWQFKILFLKLICIFYVLINITLPSSQLFFDINIAHSINRKDS